MGELLKKHYVVKTYNVDKTICENTFYIDIIYAFETSAEDIFANLAKQVGDKLQSLGKDRNAPFIYQTL